MLQLKTALAALLVGLVAGYLLAQNGREEIKAVAKQEEKVIRTIKRTTKPDGTKVEVVHETETRKVGVKVSQSKPVEARYVIWGAINPVDERDFQIGVGYKVLPKIFVIGSLNRANADTVGMLGLQLQF